ncbi:Ig-like domain-containing protein, partial [Vallitalea sediminicola]
MRKYKILKQLFAIILAITVTVTGIPINSYANDTETKVQTIDSEQALMEMTENDNFPLENENINNTGDKELIKISQDDENNTKQENENDDLNIGVNADEDSRNKDVKENEDDSNNEDSKSNKENDDETSDLGQDENKINEDNILDNTNEKDDLHNDDELNNKKQVIEVSSVIISNVAGRSIVNIYIEDEFIEQLDGKTSKNVSISEPKGTKIRLEAIDYPGADPTHIFNCWFVQSQFSNTYIANSIIEFNIEDYIKVTPWHNANLKPEEKEVIISGDSVIEIPYKNDVTKNYTAKVYDESGNIIEDSTVSWSLKNESVGVNIDQTGVVTVNNEATVGSFTIMAVTQIGTKGEMLIQLSPFAIPDAPQLMIDDINNIITGQDASRENMEYTIVDSDNWEVYDSNNPPDLTMDVVIKLRFIGTETIPPSNITTLQFNYNYSENFNDDKEIFTDIQSDNRGYLSVKHYDLSNESQVDENDRIKMFGDERYLDFIIQTPIESTNGNYYNMYNESQQGSLYFEANYNNNSHEAFEKAIVMWGYFVPEKTGEYELYAYSDDGIYGSLTVGNEDKVFVDKWQYQSPSTRGNGTVYQMQEGKIYPIYMNFFENKKSQSAFKLQMSFKGNTIDDVPGTYLYPSSKNLAYNNNVPVMGINMEPESTIINLDENDSITLNATIEPINATNKNINWTSSDDSIATVDSNGNVTLNKVGVITITATTEDGNYEDNCVITIKSNITGDSDDFFYASDNIGTLVKYYPYRNSNKTDKIASNIDDYRDIATLPDGTLVGVTQNGNLYKNIELGINEREKIGPSLYTNNYDNFSYFNDFYGVNALTSDSNGNLYYVEENYGIIRKYDITNNEITDVVATGLSSAGDIVFLDANTIYYTAYNWKNYYLVKVNIATNEVKKIARLSGIPYGIASLNDNLFVTYANDKKSYVDVYDTEGNKLNDRSDKINHLKKVFGAAQGIGKIVSNPPVAKDVRIEGSAKVGKELTGSYTYEDTEGDEEGNSRYQWYKLEGVSSSYIPINGATNKKLLITEDLIGCTIKFEVTPIAKTGTYLEGDAVRSNPTEKVVLLPFELIGPYDYDYFYLNDRNGKIIKYYPESNTYEQVAHTNKTYLDIANYNDDIIGIRGGKLYKNIITDPIKIKEISDNAINSLTYNNGLYYYVDGTQLYAYNPNTEIFYELKDVGYNSSGDLVALDGDMYYLGVTENGYYTKLIKIDFDNNYSTSVIGEYYSRYSMGIAVANETLFVGYSNRMAKVNLQNGYLYDETIIRSLNNIYGAAQGGYLNPVSSEAGLHSLLPVDEPVFNSSTTSYIKYLEPGTIIRPDVVYETIDSNATVEVVKDSQTEVEGITTVIVTAEDRTTTMTYTVEFILHHKPVIEINGDKIVVVDYNGSYTDAGAKAIDIEDDNDTLTKEIVTTVTKPNGTIVPYVDGIIDTKISGNYTVHYNVTDSTGYMAEEVTRTV